MRFLRRLVRRLAAARHPLRPVEQALGHVFADPELLVRALSHRSWINAQGGDSIDSNERLEFLGDAVLDLVITDHLFRTRPGEDEGKLSKIKSLVVSAKVLAEVARPLGIGKYILLSRSEEKAGGGERESILADAWESIIGAIYLDAGYRAAEAFLHRTLVPRLDEFMEDATLANYKSALLEYAQSKGIGAPRYEVEKTTGPEHGKKYHVRVQLQGETWGKGAGLSKKDAEQAAARKALEGRGITVT
ncbi:MAG: ribonuclease III [Fibrobacteria bacterium]|nr:ribonuclease III [Fibrobacteria bacterium]